MHVGEGGIELAARITDKQIERERKAKREREIEIYIRTSENPVLNYRALFRLLVLHFPRLLR